MFGLVILRIPLTVLYISLPWIPLFCFSLYKVVKNNSIFFNLPSFYNLVKALFSSGKSYKSWLEKILILAIASKVFYVFFEALIKPIVAWDAWSFWGLKGKIFFHSTLPMVSYFEQYRVAMPNYPFHLPLLEAWMSKCMGMWNDQLLKIVFPLYFVSLLIIFYSVLRRFFSRTHSLLFTFFLSSLPFLVYHASVAYADFLVGVYHCVGFIYLFLWMKNNDKRYLFLSAIFVGIAAWVKDEGVALLIVPALILTIYLFSNRKFEMETKILKAVKYLGTAALFFAPWMLFRRLMHIPSDKVASLSLDFDKIAIILNLFYQKLFFSGNWNITWFVIIIATILFFKRTFFTKVKYIFFAVISYLLLYIVFYIIFPGNYEILILGFTLNRNLLTFVPLAVFLLANQIVFSKEIETVPKKEENRRERRRKKKKH